MALLLLFLLSRQGAMWLYDRGLKPCTQYIKSRYSESYRR